MVDLKAKVIPESEAFSVMNLSNGGDGIRAFVGNGRDNIVCGNCGYIIEENVRVGEVMRICVKCRCGSFNLVE